MQIKRRVSEILSKTLIITHLIGVPLWIVERWLRHSSPCSW